MSRQIFVNLPVQNLEKSVEFFTALGFQFNPVFTNEKGACMIISETSFVMLLAVDFFKTFTKKEICDSKNNTEVIIALSASNRQEVDDMYRKAIKAGATESKFAEDEGWMYGRSFQDLDGHIWEIIYMDLTAFPQQK